MENNKKLVLSLSEAAECADVSIPTLTAWANRPDFPAFRSGRRWIIPADSFKRWLEDRANERASV